MGQCERILVSIMYLIRWTRQAKGIAWNVDYRWEKQYMTARPEITIRIPYC